MLELLRKNTGTEKRLEGDDTLIVLYDMGYDSGKFSHIRVQYGMVDVRTLQSAIADDESGYQRLLTSKRVEPIINDFHYSQLNPINISIRSDGKRYVVDGQARTSIVRTLFRRGELASPMVSCTILRNASLEDEATKMTVRQHC